MKHIQSIIVFVIICISGFSQETSTVTDPRDGKVYTTVKIGNRWIMSQNLAYRPEKGLFWADTAFFEKDIKAPYVLDRDTAMYKFKNGKAYFAFGYQSDDKSEGKLIVNSDDYYIAVGTLIFDSTKFFAKNLFDGYLVLNSVLFERYGYLYDFETAKASAIPGWHVPTSDEWKELLKNIGGNAKNQFIALMPGGDSGFNAGLCGWGSFVPGGLKHRDFNESQGSFWSSSKAGHMGVCLDFNGPPVLRQGATRIGLINLGTGLSVRLVKDN
jgi:uncharacterized protein (TIGR02145 family)